MIAYSSRESLDEWDGLFASRVCRSGLAHQLDSLPCGKALRIFGVIGAKVIDVRLQLQKRLPLCVRQRLCLLLE